MRQQLLRAHQIDEARPPADAAHHVTPGAIRRIGAITGGELEASDNYSSNTGAIKRAAETPERVEAQFQSDSRFKLT